VTQLPINLPDDQIHEFHEKALHKLRLLDEGEDIYELSIVLGLKYELL